MQKGQRIDFFFRYYHLYYLIKSVFKNGGWKSTVVLLWDYYIGLCLVKKETNSLDAALKTVEKKEHTHTHIPNCFPLLTCKQAGLCKLLSH